ncbi:MULTISPECIES: phytoene/squalene synthase family protein [Streptomyces]|uniref:phytoene/squalene synthase family protein n=1 Tax=Streptomyces TaxID=1883 RepID=UPI00163C7E5B|nr:MULTISPECIES: squalene/phytoene synthase family protein [Streptomyces]MBC2878584.1 squalene/phytoene synthase family protein [Streptomyces sp. TYQ1024]UBI35241.1 squalene/phytoene synthase family protein [Streptomyces mobaraensis]UKW27832.1 squalene/phytoene synthase family protein [Streptomyces sp. TYQ1024]
MQAWPPGGRSWERALTAADIDDPRLRAAYTRQRAVVAGYRRHAYLAVRLLLPPALVPHAIATTAFMHHTDNLLDRGPGAAGAWPAWEARVRAGLAGEADADGHPVLAPLLRTVAAHPRLRGHVEDFLAGAPLERDATGFATEADYQKYVDVYALPAFMTIAALLLAPEADADASREVCRAYIDGSQRLDFVNDLSEDLRDGRLGLSEEALARYGVTRAALEHGRDAPGVRDLLRDQLLQARRDLLAARRLVAFAPPGHRAFTRAVIALETLTAGAALAAGPAVLRHPVRPPLPGALAVLLREYRRRGR